MYTCMGVAYVWQQLNLLRCAADVGELALEGCTVHLFDHDSLKLQTIHSTVSDHLQQLKGQGLLSQEYQLKVSVFIVLLNDKRHYLC